MKNQEASWGATNQKGHEVQQVATSVSNFDVAEDGWGFADVVTTEYGINHSEEPFMD